MKLRTGAALAAMTISTLGITAGTAAAEPVADTPDIHFQAVPNGRSVVLTADAGTLTVADNHLQFVDRSGTTVATLPLAYLRGGDELPIAAQVEANTVTLTPSTDPADARPAEASTIADIDAMADPNFNASVGNFSMEMMASASVGSLLGSVVGGVVGCVAGGIAGGAAGGVVTLGVLALPGAVGGCLVTGAALAGIGATVGVAVTGIPTLIAGGTQFWNSTH
ncbi:hypothetical protein [Nocardia stercoris]|uniref:DUF8020 domain-containing protein n=1 Tax=Nocardia stercoris TaxID=2483361 RepID=A0A3M2KSR4_9NOCA|nr:hypothetical protein [Nocardia stercoris]RMI28479.1 hypothetical protein EBN03_30140 [Nocardia stercoris]